MFSGLSYFASIFGGVAWGAKALTQSAALSCHGGRKGFFDKLPQSKDCVDETCGDPCALEGLILFKEPRATLALVDLFEKPEDSFCKFIIEKKLFF